MNLSLIFQAWLKYPALFYGLSMLLGYFCYFFSSAYSFIPLLALWLPFLYEATTQKKGLHLSCYLSIFLCLSCYIHARSSFACLDLPEKGLEGQAFLLLKSGLLFLVLAGSTLAFCTNLTVLTEKITSMAVCAALYKFPAASSLRGPRQTMLT